MKGPVAVHTDTLPKVIPKNNPLPLQDSLRNRNHCCHFSLEVPWPKDHGVLCIGMVSPIRMTGQDSSPISPSLAAPSPRLAMLLQTLVGTKKAKVGLESVLTKGKPGPTYTSLHLWKEALPEVLSIFPLGPKVLSVVYPSSQLGGTQMV